MTLLAEPSAPADAVPLVVDVDGTLVATDLLHEAALQFVAAHPLVVSVIPGAVSPKEIDANIALLEAATPPAFWRDLKLEGLVHADAPVPE